MNVHQNNNNIDDSRREARGARPTGGEVPFSVTRYLCACAGLHLDVSPPSLSAL